MALQNNHTFSVTGVTIDLSHNSQNQKSIANENINPTQTSAWQALQKHFDEMKDVTIADLFAKDSDRFTKLRALTI
jgi:glucose-6-phosphate isomerase